MDTHRKHWNTYGRRVLTAACLAILTATASAQGKGAFPIFAKGISAPIVVDKDEWKGVVRAAGNLSQDISMVTTREKPEVRVVTDAGKCPSGGCIIVGTIGRNGLVDRMIQNGEIDVSTVRGQWESYVIQPTRDGNLVVAGSDRRGTIFGVYEISRRMGVSPWTWWADVPVKTQSSVYWKDGRVVCPSPKVKYRGIFINDEDWGMKPWASTTYEAELGDIGPKTYERVCELILRLGGNMLAPAMHSVTGAFYSHPESKYVADELGVIITTSHCEPMLLNNAAETEWNTERDGEWNYRTNRSTILGKFANRIAEAHELDNIYTIAMRGVHDEGMRGQTSPAERVKVLTDVISDQRRLLELFDRRPAEEIPQIFVPYKETMDVYQAGLKVPDDVTIVWPDDNYGFMKRLSNSDEQKRSGGSGVYYHLSYLGTPHDYLWLCTTPPALMYEELQKAYDTGADRYWLLNVGDIKPMELDVQLFFDYARNVTDFSYDRMNSYQAEMLAGIFGAKYRKDFQSILDTYYRLAWVRKPEYMGWDWQWDSPERCRLRDSEFSFQNYNDAQQRLADYHNIAQRTKSIMEDLPASARPAFFELIGYPVMAAEQMTRKFLMAQLNHERHKAGDAAEANWAADASVAANDSIEAMNSTYNNMLGGKWRGMMTVPPGFVSLYQNMPELNRTEGVAPKEVKLTPDAKAFQMDGCTMIDLAKPTRREGAEIIRGIGYDWHVLQLGNAIKDADAGHEIFAEYTFDIPSSSIAAERRDVTIHVYSLPFFPIYEGKSNRFSISMDGCEPVVLENKFTEWSYPWKEQVMQNGKQYDVTLPLDRTKSRHTLRLSAVDSGQMIERVVVDWGGLRHAYLMGK